MMKEITIQVGTDRFLKMAYREGTSDRSVIGQIWAEKSYDLLKLRRGKELVEIYKSIVSSGNNPLIVDAGANIGASSLYFSELYKNSQVFALEPEINNFNLLKQNSKSKLNIKCLNAALSSKDGEMTVIDAGEGEWGFQAISSESPPPGRVVGQVRSLSVNSIIEQTKGSCRPFIAKIDIEGGEKDVFSANTEWVNDFPLIIIELHDWLFPSKGTSSTFLKCISSLDRDFVFIGENVFSIKNV
ncbi:FkbM family methyltransferase [Azospirillum sp. A1-3]|uniref:FkbM family methyltransferase n=1 Tax=Azospirillum sp. A1-3 TaxID=185874 RepID=UPI0020777EC8|nr:FkbM family methyltransferase [Azospirillum sp. A1-3]MCM8738666.1 FkbM family methyltransferase [Azospirillum sp. A1-3]